MTIGGIAIIAIIALVGMGFLSVPARVIPGADPFCGNGICEGGENAQNCVQDCGGQSQVECGKAATLHYSAFTGSWGEASSETEVYPAYSIYESGTKIVNDAAGNSTTSVATCDSGEIYCTGATYYCDIPVSYTVDKETDKADDIKAYAIVATSELVIVAYDDTESTALVADDGGANSTADYAGGALGAGEEYSYYIKLKNNVADKTFRLGAILTYYCGDEVDDFTLEESGWTKVNVPDGDLGTSFTHYDDANGSTSCNIKHAYVPTGKDYITLGEWDSIKYQFVIDTDDTSGPTANGDSYVGAVFVDFACEQDKDGNTVCDWYRHNDNADPDDIGVSEGVVTTGYMDLDCGICIEPQ